MKGNNSSGQLKFFHNISIEKQDKQQQQPKPTHTHTHTYTQNEEMQQVNCCSKQGRTIEEVFFKLTHTGKEMSQLALINIYQYNRCFVLSIVLLLQFVFLYLFNFFVESVKTNYHTTTKTHHPTTHSLTLTPVNRISRTL